MRLLIIDTNSANQVAASTRILNIAQEELDRLDVRIKLCGVDNRTIQLAGESELVILGAGLGLQTTTIARSLIEKHPDLSVVCFASETTFGSQFVKNAQLVGIRKVIPPFATAIELLQELISIDSAKRKHGRNPHGKLVLFANPKGGAGTTSTVAALGEVCTEMKQRILLWDLDADSRDLCRALSIPHPAGDTINSWVTGTEPLSREAFDKGLFKADDNLSILPPPTGTAESMDLICHSDGQAIVYRIVELARYTHDLILVDVGSTMGPAVATLFHLADEIVLLTGECPLSITATEHYVEKIKNITGSTLNIRILVAGSRIPAASVRADLQATLRLRQSAWELPELPNCAEASYWAGSGHTIYSLGSNAVRFGLREIARQLGLIDPPKLPMGESARPESSAVRSKLRQLKEAPRRIFQMHAA